MNDLGCICLLDNYDGAQAEVCTETYRTARKEHRCCECGGTIQPGAVYEYVRGLWDGYWSTFKTCLPCARIRQDYCCSWTYGTLRETLWDAMDFDYVTGAEGRTWS